MWLAKYMHRFRLMFGAMCIVIVLSAAEMQSGSGSYHDASNGEGNPRMAYGALLGLVHLGFEEGVEPLCTANDSAGRSAIARFRELTASIGRLHDAEWARFGNPGAFEPEVSLPISAGHPEMIYWSDRAILRYDGRRDIPMVHVDGAWRLDMTALVDTGGFTREDAMRFHREAARIDKTTCEILTQD
jgi:hypothetical protein